MYFCTFVNHLNLFLNLFLYFKRETFHLCIQGYMQMKPLPSLLGNRCSISMSWVSPKCSTSYSLRVVVRTSAARHCLISYSSCSQTSHRVPLTAVQWDTNSQNNNWRNDTVVSQTFRSICLVTYCNIRPKSLTLNINLFTLDSGEKLISKPHISSTINLAIWAKFFIMRIKFMLQLSWSEVTKISLNNLRKDCNKCTY